MNNYCDLAKELAKAVSSGEAEILYRRTLSKPDIDGLRYILKSKDVGAIFVIPRMDWREGVAQNEELFYKMKDPELHQRGKQALIEEWFNGVFPPAELGEIFMLKAADHSYEGEAMACLVEPGRWSFIWTRRYFGNIRVGEYAMCSARNSLEELIRERKYLFCVMERIKKP